jgi:hypothetical protein
MAARGHKKLEPPAALISSHHYLGFLITTSI